jgi:hypothetical protein
MFLGKALSFLFVANLAYCQVRADKVYHASGHNLQPQVLQVTLNRINENGASLCTVTSFTKTQQHRLLLKADDVIVDIRKTEDRTGIVEYIKILGYHEQSLWNKTDELCSAKISSMYITEENAKTSYDAQSTFAVPNAFLDTQALLVSGPPENRVDFIFLADGCEFSNSKLNNILLTRRFNLIQILSLKGTNSLRMLGD